MSVTEDLRAMLDEMGVEYTAYDDRTTDVGPSIEIVEHTGKRFNMRLRNITAAHAVEATLGRGECEITDMDTGETADYMCREHIMHCEGCHHEYGYVQYNEDGDVWMDEKPKYCPICGRRVKEDL